LVAELGRVVGALGRYLGDIALPDATGPHTPEIPSLMAATATRPAPLLTRLSPCRSGIGLLDRRDPGAPSPSVSAAGRAGRRYWAAVAASGRRRPGFPGRRG
jgi:hypothetical protein